MLEYTRMKLAISILVGLLIALLILQFTNLESYVLAPVTYDRAQDFNPDDEETRIIRAVAAATGTNISETQARAALAASAPPVGPPPIMALPGTMTPLAAPSPAAAQQIMAQPPAVVQATEAVKAAQAAQAAQADAAGGATGGAFTGGGGVGSITQITGGGAPLMGGAAMQPITAGAAGFGTPAPAPKPPLSGGAPAPAPRSARRRAPAPAPRARRQRAPPPKGPKTRREVLLEEIDDILVKLRS
jgi:hypothetical protein